MNLYGINENRLVVDPVSEGGDGKPEFDCPGCASLKRAIDFMKRDHTDPSLYCNAAFATKEHLDAIQQEGFHCNKTVVSTTLAAAHRGFALNSKIAAVMTAHLYDLKYDGHLAEHYLTARPKFTCLSSNTDASQKKQRLTISDLTGIWVVVYTFAVAGLVAKAMVQMHSFKGKGHKTKWADQWGNPLPNPKALEVKGEDGAPAVYTLDPRLNSLRDKNKYDDSD